MVLELGFSSYILYIFPTQLTLYAKNLSTLYVWFMWCSLRFFLLEFGVSFCFSFLILDFFTQHSFHLISVFTIVPLLLLFLPLGFLCSCLPFPLFRWIKYKLIAQITSSINCFNCVNWIVTFQFKNEHFPYLFTVQMDCDLGWWL